MRKLNYFVYARAYDSKSKLELLAGFREELDAKKYYDGLSDMAYKKIEKVGK
jgi:hypothetical protein